MWNCESNIGSHNLKRKAFRRLSNFRVAASACGGKRAESKTQRSTLSDYDRVRNIPFRHGRRLGPLFYIPFPASFFPRASIYTPASARKCIGRCSSASTCCHAKCNAHAMQKRAAAVTLFASTRASIPPDKGINRVTSTGERISASEIGCARPRAQVRFPRRDTKYAVARKWVLRSSAVSHRVSNTTNCHRQFFIAHRNSRELYYLRAMRTVKINFREISDPGVLWKRYDGHNFTLNFSMR